MSQLEAVAAGRHIHVCEKHVNLQPRFHQHQSLGAIGCLDNSEAGIFKKLGQEETDQRLVFNQKDCGMGRQHHFVTRDTIRDNDSWSGWFHRIRNYMKLYPVAWRMDCRLST